MLNAHTAQGTARAASPPATTTTATRAPEGRGARARTAPPKHAVPRSGRGWESGDGGIFVRVMSRQKLALACSLKQLPVLLGWSPAAATGGGRNSQVGASSQRELKYVLPRSFTPILLHFLKIATHVLGYLHRSF